MHGRLVVASRVKVSDGFSANRAVNFTSGTFTNVCTLLWVLVVVLEASPIGEIFSVVLLFRNIKLVIFRFNLSCFDGTRNS